MDLNHNTLIIGNWDENTTYIASGAISGNGNLSLRGNAPDPIRIQGSTGNTYTGTTVLEWGAVSLEKTSGNALCGSITVNGGGLVWTADNQIDDASDVTLKVREGGTYLNLAGHNDTIHDLYLSTVSTVNTGAGGVLKVNRLFINGVEQTPGVAYGAGTGFVVESGYIDVGNSGPPVITTPPAAPGTPVPTDGLATVFPPKLTKLDWDSCALAASYDVYCWLSTEDKPTTPTANVALSEYTLSGQLPWLSTYKWQVVAKNTMGDTAGPVWTFTTGDLCDISNANIPANPNRPDDGVEIDEYLGTANTARLVGTTQTFWTSGFTKSVNLNGNTFYIDSGNNENRAANGAIFGNGVIIFRNTGGLPGRVVGGATGNTYTGPTTVSGIVTLNKTAGDALCSGPITLNLDWSLLVWAASDQIHNTSNLTLTTAGAKLNLAGFSDTIASLTLATGTSVETGTGGVLTTSALTVNGALMDPGAYTASNSTFVLGTGSVMVGAPQLIAEAGVSQTVNPGSPSVTLGGSPSATGGIGPYVSYSWSPTTGLDDATLANPTASPKVTTTYTLSVTDSTLPTPVIATDTVTVTADFPFNTWAALMGLTAGNNGPNDDPDADGVPNYMEFAFNGNPKSAAANGMIHALTETSADHNYQKVLVLTIAVRTGGTNLDWADNIATIDGITYTIEGGTTLGDFSPGDGKIFTCAAPITTGLSADPGTGYEWRSFILNSSEGLGTKGFLRAMVEQ